MLEVISLFYRCIDTHLGNALGQEIGALGGKFSQSPSIIGDSRENWLESDSSP